MDDYRELSDRLKAFGNSGRQISIAQGIVTAVEGVTCSVRIGGIVIPDVRLRASISARDGETLVVPRTGTAVTVGSLSGDLSELVVLQVDEVESIRVNGGSLGGLVNIGALTDKLNDLIESFNGHTHTCATQGSPTTVPLAGARRFSRQDYEDERIKH